MRFYLYLKERGGYPMARYRHGDVIAAIATPAGSGGVGLIRISGNGAEQVFSRVFPKWADAVNHPRTVVYGDIAGVDDGFGLWLAAPRSYTGEDTAELQCHGGGALMRRVLEQVLEAGARMAEPGEFTLRAFLNGRMDLSQAEAVQELIDAGTPAAAQQARARLHGSLGSKIAEMEAETLDLMGRITASVDFPDEIDPPAESDVLSLVHKLSTSLTEILSTADQGILYREGVLTALVGRVNAGKSSLMNSLLKADRAIVTELPGTTRDVIEEKMDLMGIPVSLCDTAGFRGENVDKAEAEGMERSRRLMEEAVLRLVVVDASAPALPDMPPLSPAQKCIYVLNKCDVADPASALTLLPTDAVVCPISAKTGEGIPHLLDTMHSLLLGAGSEGAVLLGNLRQKEALYRAREHLTEAASALEAGMPLDLIGVDLENAVNALGEITGRTASEAVLDNIFSRFCLGK